MNKCLCGCDMKIIYQNHHKYYGIPKFICGHSNKLLKYREAHGKLMKGKYIGNKNPFFNKKHTSKSLLKMSISHRLNNPLKNRTYEEIMGEDRAKLRRLRLSNKIKEQHKNLPNYAMNGKKQSEYQKENMRKWFINNIKSFCKRPNKFEQEIIKLIEKNKLLYKYVGCGDFWIGNRNPDFININGKKICIEIYQNYFKIKRYGSIEIYELDRQNHYFKYGYQVIFINYDELGYPNKIVDKLKLFKEVD